MTVKIDNLPTRKSAIMLEEYEKKKEKQVSSMRSGLHYGRAILFTGLGILFFFHEKLNIPTSEKISPGAVKAIGVLFVLYGLWNFYRGFKKKYFQ